jgi:hypothetical protein
VSDSHAQYERPLSAMLEMIEVWGQKMPRYCYTQREQERVDLLLISSSNAARADKYNTTEYESINRSQCQFISRYEDINTVCDLIRNALIGAEVWHVGLDCKWGVVYNAVDLVLVKGG